MANNEIMYFNEKTYKHYKERGFELPTGGQCINTDMYFPKQKSNYRIAQFIVKKKKNNNSRSEL